MRTFAMKHSRAALPQVATVQPAAHGQTARIRYILGRNTVQPKLRIGSPNDAYEREADRVAARAMRMPTPQADGTSLLQRREDETVRRFCAECEEELQRQPLEEPEEEELLAKRAAGEEDVPAVEGDLDSRIRRRQGGGQPLPESARPFFEPRFGKNFGDVRIHADREAQIMTHSIAARAFAFGGDIYFDRGEYRPQTAAGRSLLADELAHVVQQKAKPRTTLEIQRHSAQNCDKKDKEEIEESHNHAKTQIGDDQLFYRDLRLCKRNWTGQK
jgi:hypothetical protein